MTEEQWQLWLLAFVYTPLMVVAFGGVAVVCARIAARRHNANRAAESKAWCNKMAEKQMVTQFEVEQRLLELEGKARVRRIWIDAGKKSILGFAFMAGAACLGAGGTNNWTTAASVFFIFGGCLLAMI